MLEEEEGYNLPKAGLMILDPPFGYQKHDRATPGSGDWDSRPWSGEDVKTCIQGYQAAGFLDTDCIVLIYHPAQLTGEYWAALDQLGFTNHQIIYFHKPGFTR